MATTTTVRTTVRVVVKRDPGSCRHRAYMYVNDRLVAVWPIENSTCTKRYKPLKPVPPTAQLILNALPQKELEKLALFLLTARDGDEYVVNV